VTLECGCGIDGGHVFKVVAVWDGKKSEPLPFRRIEDAKAEAQTCIIQEDERADMNALIVL
jgi:hypothetical protein